MSFSKFATVSMLALAAFAYATPHAAFAAKASAMMKMLDPDGDGTVSLDEAQAAGAKKFAAMDPDNDGTIDMKEGKAMSKAAFKNADPDNDGTIDKAEYSALVESAFKAADPDGDGTLDAKELTSPAGKKLLSLIK